MMNGNRRWLKATLIVILWVGCAGAVSAQTMNAGDIRGIVTDTTGAAVPGVTVTVLNKNTGVVKELITNQDGLYDTSSIVAGSYEVTFSKTGFSKLVRSNITIDVKEYQVNAQLSVGAVTEQVIVNTDLPLLETENGEQSSTLEAATLQQLPEVGQDWQHFTLLLPGATGAPGGSQGSADPQQVASINGNLPFSTILADGASVTLPSSANADVMVLETVQELKGQLVRLRRAIRCRRHHVQPDQQGWHQLLPRRGVRIRSEYCAERGILQLRDWKGTGPPLQQFWGLDWRSDPEEEDVLLLQL